MVWTQWQLALLGFRVLFSLSSSIFRTAIISLFQIHVLLKSHQRSPLLTGKHLNMTCKICLILACVYFSGLISYHGQTQPCGNITWLLAPWIPHAFNASVPLLKLCPLIRMCLVDSNSSFMFQLSWEVFLAWNPMPPQSHPHRAKCSLLFGYLSTLTTLLWLHLLPYCDLQVCLPN